MISPKSIKIIKYETIELGDLISIFQFCPICGTQLHFDNGQGWCDKDNSHFNWYIDHYSILGYNIKMDVKITKAVTLAKSKAD